MFTENMEANKDGQLGKPLCVLKRSFLDFSWQQYGTSPLAVHRENRQRTESSGTLISKNRYTDIY